jgi:hypothetical protein
MVPQANRTAGNAPDARTGVVAQRSAGGWPAAGKAAALLGVDRWAMLDLMTRRQVPSGPADAADLRRELEDAERLAPPAPASGVGDRAGRRR